jgi:hypothetical protein
VRRIEHGKCFVRWRHCARREKWGKYHETGKSGRRGYVQSPLQLPGDTRDPWDREPGSEG